LLCRFGDKERIGIDVRSGAIAWRKEEAGFGYHHTPEFVGDVAYSGDRGLSAYDLKTGELLWRQDFNQETGWLSSSPRIFGGRVYVGSKDGAFHIVEAATGVVFLSQDVDFEPQVVLPLGRDRVVVGGHEEIACFSVA
jgi:outer membrane protein assembly factor BamB